MSLAHSVLLASLARRSDGSNKKQWFILSYETQCRTGIKAKGNSSLIFNIVEVRVCSDLYCLYNPHVTEATLTKPDEKALGPWRRNAMAGADSVSD